MKNLKKATLKDIRKSGTKVIVKINGKESHQTMRLKLKNESMDDYLKYYVDTFKHYVKMGYAYLE